MIHIVGLYKCGTSWLLHMLAAHPEVIAWREFDPVRATFAPDRRLRTWPGTLLDYGWRRRGATGWMTRREASLARAPETIFREMFLGRGWIPLMGAERQAQALALPRDDLDALLTQLLALGDLQVRDDAAPLADPRQLDNRLGVAHCRRDDLLALMQTVRDGRDPALLPAEFYRVLQAQAVSGTRVAFKAADQVMQLSRLRDAAPHSRLLAVVRDGRDAMISAAHYERLMRKREAPWRTGDASAQRRLLGWAVRAAKLAEHARRGEVVVVRYEDLHADFAGTCRALLRELALTADTATVAHIQQATNFAAVTGGRQPGEAAEAVVRKGSVGEWQEVLPRASTTLAWQLAHRELAAFGYTRDGGIQASPLVLGAG